MGRTLRPPSAPRRIAGRVGRDDRQPSTLALLHRLLEAASTRGYRDTDLRTRHSRRRRKQAGVGGVAEQPPILRNYPLAQVRQTDNGVSTYGIVWYWWGKGTALPATVDGRSEHGRTHGPNTGSHPGDKDHCHTREGGGRTCGGELFQEGVRYDMHRLISGGAEERETGHILVGAAGRELGKRV